MKTLLIQLILSSTFYVLVYILLLIVAGVIGYITAWFYAKWVYTPVIRELEGEKADLNRQVEGLKMDIGDLKRKVESLNEKTASLEKELVAKEKEIKKLKEVPKKKGAS